MVRLTNAAWTIGAETPRFRRHVRLAGKEIMSNLFADRERSEKRQMDDSVKDRLASQVLELLIDFEMALSERKRKYPAQEFFAFASAARRYIELTRKDQLVRRDVAVALKDLAACIEVMRKGVPDAVVLEAHRLESLFFDGYDPYFEGDEPPGCRVDKTVRLVCNFGHSRNSGL
jgi:hypothetical protein